MQGQPKKSARLKELQGNTRRRAKPALKNDVEPPSPAPGILETKVFFSGAWQPAPWLSEGAKKIWVEQLPIVRRDTKIQESALQVFAAYCDALYRLQKYSREIEALGATYTTDRGFVRKRPEVDMRDRAANEVRNYAGELNLTTKSWIGSMGTFAGRQLDMFMHGGRDEVAPTPGASPAKGDGLDAFLGKKPTMQ